MAEQFVPRDAKGDIKYDYDIDEEVFKVALKVWNPTSLEWERMKQPVLENEGDLTISMGDVEAATNTTYWRRTKYAYDVSDNIEYKGRHTTFNAAGSDTNWYIIKYTYDGSGNLIDKQLAVGAWDDRATLGW